MSITLRELLAWSARLPDPNGEEALMLHAMITRRESELRLVIANLIAKVSDRENWKLQHCTATARRAELVSVDRLDAIHDYFFDRSEGRLHFEAADNIFDVVADNPVVFENAASPVASADNGFEPETSAPIIDLYQRMKTLEASVAVTPGVSCGMQGIRIMRVVALMSHARSAKHAKLRVNGIQATYQHQ